MISPWRLPVAILTMLLAACSGEEAAGPDAAAAAGTEAWLVELQQQPEYVEACEQTPGCADAESTDTAEQVFIWRIQVIRDANGDVSFGRVDSLSVAADIGLPPGRATGDYLLVGVSSDGKPVDGQLIQFPRERRLEFSDQPPVTESLEGQQVDTVAYVRADPAIVRLEVQDKDGRAVATREPPAVSSTGSPGKISPWALIPEAHALTSLTRGVPPHCSHIWILKGEIDRPFAGTLAFDEEIATLEVPGPYHMAAVKAALNRMTPLLCGAIGRIAFARMELMEQYAAGAVLQAGEGDIIMINTATYPESELAGSTWSQLQMQTTLTHESGHSVEALLNAEGADPNLYGGDWEVPQRARARQALDNTRLHKGFGEEWRRVHNSFVDAGWARAHSISGMAVPLPDDKVVSGGFMTSYGSNIWWDDISEFISEIYMGPVFRAQGLKSYDLACKAMQSWGDQSIPSGLAAPYAKVMLLRDLELVRAGDVSACTGSNIGLHVTQKGFHIWQDGQFKRSLTDNLHAGIGTETFARNRVFTMQAEGEAGFGGKTYPATIRLRLDLRGIGDDLVEVSWPRGYYELGLTGDNNLQITLDGAAAGNFDTMDGSVLITESSSKRITGSAVLQRVFRLQAPIPVPERYDPPLVIRFMIEK